MQVNPQHHELPPVLQTKLVSDNQQTDKHPKDYDLHEKCVKFNTVRMFDDQLSVNIGRPSFGLHQDSKQPCCLD